MKSEKTQSRSDQIFADLRQRVLSDDLAAGSRLPAERQLADAYGANRHTLREAIRRLEQARLVRVRHGQGVTVQDFRKTGTMDVLEPFLRVGRDVGERAHLLQDILQVRTAFLVIVVRFAAQRATPQDQARLRERVATQISAFQAGDRVTLARGDVAYLDTLVDAAQSLAARWLANTILEVYRALAHDFPGLWLREPTYPEHMRDLLAAIDAGDADAAEATVRRYYARNDAQIIALLDQLASGLAGEGNTSGTDHEPGSR